MSWIVLLSPALATCPDLDWSAPAEAQVIVEGLQARLSDISRTQAELRADAFSAGCASTVLTYEEGLCSGVADVQRSSVTYACELGAHGLGAEGGLEERSSPDSLACGDGLATSVQDYDLQLIHGDALAELQRISLRGVSRSECPSSSLCTAEFAESWTLDFLDGEIWSIEYSRSFIDRSPYAETVDTVEWSDCDSSLSWSSSEDALGLTSSWTLVSPEHELQLSSFSPADPSCEHSCGCSLEDATVQVVLDGVSSTRRAMDLGPATDADGDGALAEGTDCDDSDADVNICAVDDSCDALDNDCDGGVDEDVAPVYADMDGDGHGAGPAMEACDGASSGVPRGGDCDDAEAAVHPEAEDLRCDGLDQDCDGIDEGEGWVDGDGDGHAGTLALGDCAGLEATATDCDDGAPLVSPDGEELCNGIDDDCDGQTDADVGRHPIAP